MWPGAIEPALEALEKGDPFLEGVAWRVISSLPPRKDATEALVLRLPKLTARARARLVEALAERGDASAGPAVMGLVKSPDEGVRIAAIRALGILGDASAVEALAGIAADPAGPARDAAAESLARLSHPEVDVKILSWMFIGPPSVRAQFVRAAAARRIPGVTKALLEAARDPDETVRSSALEALATSGSRSPRRRRRSARGSSMPRERPSILRNPRRSCWRRSRKLGIPRRWSWP
jgi:HEAT repeat protein